LESNADTAVLRLLSVITASEKQAENFPVIWMELGTDVVNIGGNSNVHETNNSYTTIWQI
jgi:hypothetical protein